MKLFKAQIAFERDRSRCRLRTKGHRSLQSVDNFFIREIYIYESVSFSFQWRDTRNGKKNSTLSKRLGHVYETVNRSGENRVGFDHRHGAKPREKNGYRLVIDCVPPPWKM